jgi:predicted permease
MRDLLSETRQVARALFRNPGFTLLAVLTIAGGIGVNTAMFSVIESVILHPLPYRDPAGLVMLWSGAPAKDIQKNWTSFPDIQDWRSARSFDQIAGMLRINTADITSGDQVERLNVGRVSSELFSVLGVPPLMGRSWTAQEEDRRAPNVVISYPFWQTHFGGASDVIGKTLVIDHQPATVVGVMPSHFDFPTAHTSVWVPLTFVASWPAFLTARQADAFNAVARLKSGYTPQQAQMEMNAISARLSKQYPRFENGKSINVVPLTDDLVSPGTRTSLWMLFCAVLFVLLIACVNVASLLLARQTLRQKENAVRVALGAGRAQIIRLHLIESLVLSIVAALPGAGLAAAAAPYIRAFGPAGIRGLAEVHLDLKVLAFCAFLSAATGVFLSLGPAWLSARRDPQDTLKAGSRTIAGSRASRRLGHLLMTIQLALAMVLVTGTGLMLRSFLQSQHVDLGFDPQRLLFLHLDAPAATNSDTNQPVQLLAQALTRISSIPGVKGAGAVDKMFSSYVPDDVIEIEGQGPASIATNTDASTSHVVGGAYFETVGIPLLRGRLFSSTDSLQGQPVSVINQSMAKRFWPNKDPVGKRFRFGVPGETSEWHMVVGVVADSLPDGPESRVSPLFYLPQSQRPWVASMDIVIRVADDRLPLANAIRAAVLSVNNQVPKFAVTTVDAELDALGTQRRFSTWLLSSFSAFALVLAAIGIYGMVSYSVTERTAEIGVRMAFGAARADIMRLVLGQVLLLAGGGLLSGLAAAMIISRTAANLLFGVAPTDGVTLTGATLLLLMVALLAGYVPARRATRVDPAIALTAE